MIDGVLTLRGVDASTLTLRRLLNAVYALLAEHKDDEGIEQLDRDLNGPGYESPAAKRRQADAAARLMSEMPRLG
jgi:hypothetical protein